ncbi:MAG: HAMP domain-containing sensor histidine kinase [Pseudomonadota bacterium]
MSALQMTPSNWRQQAHDIKNIMATISMVAEELGAAQTQRGQTLGKRLERSCIRILEICSVNNFTNPEPEAAQALDCILSDVVALAEGIAPDGVRIHARCNRSVDLDEETGAAVFRILANLTTNSVGAMAHMAGSVALDASVANGEIMITVTDEGPGLGAAAGQLACEGLPKRSGMGLTIACTLADRIDGTLDLVRTGPDGTCFCLTLDEPKH